ncbi:hypothetical protein [Rhizobium sp. X9]|uniref:hypothetical protein n=1 Tax=Rhizobium sp. X9 TaxID=2815360 RepID=UPI001C0D02BB|nr:hypothetical protein [Rhizobium sp. X9]
MGEDRSGMNGWMRLASHLCFSVVNFTMPHRLPDFFEGREAVDVMHLVEVDVNRPGFTGDRLA